MDHELDAPLPRTYTENRAFMANAGLAEGGGAAKRRSADLKSSQNTWTAGNREVRTELEEGKDEQCGKGGDEEDISEPEFQIRSILKSRAFHWTAIVEETPSDLEEDSDSDVPSKPPPASLQPLISAFQQLKAQELEYELLHRRSIRDRLFTLLDDPLVCATDGKLQEEYTESEDSRIDGFTGSDLDSTTDGNLQTVIVAIETLCLPGELFKKQRESVLETLRLTLNKGCHFAIHLSSAFPANQYCGVYAVDREQGRLTKVSGSVLECSQVYLRDVSSYFLFDGGEFRRTQGANMFDAFHTRD